MKNISLLAAIALGLAGLADSTVSGDVKLPEIFGDHMVLQRDIAIPFWGWGDPGETVTVTAGSDQATTTVGPKGEWSLKLTKLQASDKPVDVTVAGKNTIILHDVLVGDVWVCSGQSNMEYGMGPTQPKEELDKTDQPQIRLFFVPRCVAPAPSDHIGPPPPLETGFQGVWQVCSPATVCQSRNRHEGFTAVGFYFGRDIHDFTHQPVGLIESSWGGTRVGAWTSLEKLKSIPEAKPLADQATAFREKYPQLKDDFDKILLPKWNVDFAKWNEENKDALKAYAVVKNAWIQQVKVAQAQDQPLPPPPPGPVAPPAPKDPALASDQATVLFNGMIDPLIPYGIKGAIWYQGESDVGAANRYKLVFPGMMSDWRTRWGEGDFSFLFVQLPNYRFFREPDKDALGLWTAMREAQASVLTLPNTGMAVTYDVGEGTILHPPDKYDVGHRLALAAEHVAYGQELVYSGPAYKGKAVEGNKIRISFDRVGGGLIIGVPPEHYHPGEPKVAASELQGFVIAGADHKFISAKATIDGDGVLVSSDAVPSPVDVRYAWADNPVANLYNKEGLSASPFRTDDLELPIK